MTGFIVGTLFGVVVVAAVIGAFVCGLWAGAEGERRKGDRP